MSHLLEQEHALDVWEDNVESLQVFLAMQTQWKTHSFGGFPGLDYPALMSVMDMMDVSDKKQCFSDMRLMESQALNVFRKRQERETKSNGKGFTN